MRPSPHACTGCGGEAVDSLVLLSAGASSIAHSPGYHLLGAVIYSLNSNLTSFIHYTYIVDSVLLHYYIIFIKFEKVFLILGGYTLN